MKKIISFLLAAIISCVSLCASVSAAAVPEDFDEYLSGQLGKFSKSIDITYYIDKYSWDQTELSDILQSFVNDHPELFFVSTKDGISLNEELYSNGTSSLMLSFSYIMSGSSVTSAQKKLDAAAKKAVEGITDDMSDIDKALYVHDYLILNCAYDTKKTKYSAYNCLVDKACVCMGFTLAYEYILNNYLGIECTAAYANETTHVWNYVKIDGKWYHVDLTEDDTYDAYKNKSYDRYGYIRHENFLMSDEKCKKTSSLHKNWQIAGDCPAASDKSYDKAFWTDVNSALIYSDGNYYYAQDTGESDGKRLVTVYRYNVESQKRTALVKLKSRWYLSRDSKTGVSYEYGKRFYTSAYASIAYKDGKLYFNTNKCVYSYDLSTKKYKKIYTLGKGESQQIYGLAMVDGKLRLAYRKDFTYAESYLKLILK